MHHSGSDDRTGPPRPSTMESSSEALIQDQGIARKLHETGVRLPLPELETETATAAAAKTLVFFSLPNLAGIGRRSETIRLNLIWIIPAKEILHTIPRVART